MNEKREILKKKRLTKTRSFISRISMIKTRHVTSFTMISNNTFRCTETFTRFTSTLSALIITKTCCNKKI